MFFLNPGGEETLTRSPKSARAGEGCLQAPCVSLDAGSDQVQAKSVEGR